MSLDTSITVRAPTLADKVAYLSQASTYGLGTREAVVLRETHMSGSSWPPTRYTSLRSPFASRILIFRRSRNARRLAGPNSS